MLGRHLPFDSQDDKEISQKTVQQDISFTHPVWKSVSEEGKDLIFKLLRKNPKERITIDKVLEHPWITESNKSIRELRRKSSDCGDKLMKFITYSNTNFEQIRQNSPSAAEKLVSMTKEQNAGKKDAGHRANAYMSDEEMKS